MDNVPELVLKYLNFTGKCFRHCDQPTSMRIISQNPNSLVGAYICPDGFVSQVVYFSTQPDREWFQAMLRDQLGAGNVNDRDIRLASRHGWELGKGAQEAFKSSLGETSVLLETYWTRYPQTEEQKQQAVSLCVGEGAKAGCSRLFIHDRKSVERFCPSCKARNNG